MFEKAKDVVQDEGQPCEDIGREKTENRMSGALKEEVLAPRTAVGIGIGKGGFLVEFDDQSVFLREQIRLKIGIGLKRDGKLNMRTKSPCGPGKRFKALREKPERRFTRRGTRCVTYAERSPDEQVRKCGIHAVPAASTPVSWRRRSMTAARCAGRSSPWNATSSGTPP